MVAGPSTSYTIPTLGTEPVRNGSVLDGDDSVMVQITF
jgi:hypothetical protein